MSDQGQPSREPEVTQAVTPLVAIPSDMINLDGSLDSLDRPCYYNGWDFVCWYPGEAKIILDGEFTPEQLEALVTYVRARH